MGAVRVGITSLLVGMAVVVACGSDEPVGDACTAREQRTCECDGGLSGTQVCLQDQTGFTSCSCSGATSDAGGSPTEAGADGPVPEAGPPAEAGDAALVDAGSPVTPDGSTGAMDVATDGPSCVRTFADGLALAECNLCVEQNCCAELLACVAPDPCDANNDAGVDETACMLACLGDIAAGGGAVGPSQLNQCSQICAASGANVSPATRNLFACVVGNETCRTGCGF